MDMLQSHRTETISISMAGLVLPIIYLQFQIQTKSYLDFKSFMEVLVLEEHDGLMRLYLQFWKNMMIEEIKKQTSVLEHRVLALPERYLSYKVVLPNPRFWLQ
ncbi:hypothetical protein K2173_016733 [Erythroxylum novogranatense]|uniref:Uncharacterized protein n=1 Tax=Erythroxylum novogranatense TaxID=1862640 RepID=A0AAV8SHJ4_9ROSI|nr:hypothetical protein K2173_016733 [Erythroxylum novogranatense]